MNEQCPRAVLSSEEGGFRLSYEVVFNGDEPDEEYTRISSDYAQAWEQARLMSQTMQLIGFEGPPGQPMLERNGGQKWVKATQPAPADSPAVAHVKEVLHPKAPKSEPEVQADPVLDAAVRAKAPYMTHGMAAALTAATPPKERATLVRALGETAETIFNWLLERKDQSFTVGEVAKGTRHSDHVAATRLKDLEGAGLVKRGSKDSTRGHLKKWATYRAIVQEPLPV